MSEKISKLLRKCTKEHIRLKEKQCDELGLNKNDYISNLYDCLAKHYKTLNSLEKGKFNKVIKKYLLLNSQKQV